MTNYNITDIQLFDYANKIQTTEDGDFDVQYSYSANLVINSEFIVQISGDLNEAIFDGVTDSATCFWGDEETQDNAYERINNDDLEAALEEAGFNNNINWLEDNATEVMNPENAQYRRDNTDTK